MEAVLLRFVLACLVLAAPACAAETFKIPESIFRRVAITSLGSEQSSSDLPAREEEVRTWIESMGGETWYGNYRKRYGRPASVLPHSSDDVSSPKLGPYYLSMVGEFGLDVCDRSADRGPTFRAFCALANWEEFLSTHDVRYWSAFVAGANWFVDTNDQGAWHWPIDLPTRGLSSGWISGVTESLGISVLLRAHQLTGDVKYRQVADAAFALINKDVKDGGLLLDAGLGKWIEEYPNLDRPSHVLNGHVWALFGVNDYVRATSSESAAALFRDGLLAIKANVDWYDTGFWVVYAQTNRVDFVQGNYLQFMSEQMSALFKITGDAQFDDLARRWRGYQQSDSLFVSMAAKEFMKVQSSH